MPFDIFICYETTTGKSYAENLQKALGKLGKVAFLADSSLKNTDRWQEKIDSALEEANIFMIIITALTCVSDEVKKEYEKAISLKKDIIVCRYCDIAKNEISELSVFQQIDFEDKHDLANKAIMGVRDVSGGIVDGI